MESQFISKIQYVIITFSSYTAHKNEAVEPHSSRGALSHTHPKWRLNKQ